MAEATEGELCVGVWEEERQQGKRRKSTRRGGGGRAHGRRLRGDVGSQSSEGGLTDAATGMEFTG